MLKNIITCIINMIVSRKCIFCSSFYLHNIYQVHKKNSKENIGKLGQIFPNLGNLLPIFKKQYKLGKLGNLGPLVFHKLQLITVLHIICNSYKVHLSKTMCGIFHFQFCLVFIEVYIFVQKKHGLFDFKTS